MVFPLVSISDLRNFYCTGIFENPIFTLADSLLLIGSSHSTHFPLHSPLLQTYHYFSQ
jgi:hypothetical protein